LTGLGIDEFLHAETPLVCGNPTDALGSSVALADAVGVVQTEYSYEPFGSTTTSGASSTKTHAFTGREADARHNIDPCEECERRKKGSIRTITRLRKESPSTLHRSESCMSTSVRPRPQIAIQLHLGADFVTAAIVNALV
jgi:hypothetical protein